MSGFRFCAAAAMLIGCLTSMVSMAQLAPVQAKAAGLPSYTIAGTDGAVAMPAMLPAGYVRITFVNNGKMPNELQFFWLHHSVSDRQFLAALNNQKNPEAVDGVASAAGGVNQVMPGMRGTVIVRLRVGHYVVVAFGAKGGTIRAHFRVQMRSWSDFTPPPFDTQIFLKNYQIITHYELTEREPLVVRVVNEGPSTHELSLARVPNGTTRWQVIACVKEQKPDKVCQTLMAAMSYVGGSGAIAPYSAERVEWRLPPGTYVAACFVPNMMNMPHAALGMVTVFVVQARDTDGD